jgi:hypothetical protein
MGRARAAAFACAPPMRARAPRRCGCGRDAAPWPGRCGPPGCLRCCCCCWPRVSARRPAGPRRGRRGWRAGGAEARAGQFPPQQRPARRRREGARGSAGRCPTRAGCGVRGGEASRAASPGRAPVPRLRSSACSIPAYPHWRERGAAALGSGTDVAGAPPPAPRKVTGAPPGAPRRRAARMQGGPARAWTVVDRPRCSGPRGPRELRGRRPREGVCVCRCERVSGTGRATLLERTKGCANGEQICDSDTAASLPLSRHARPCVRRRCVVSIQQRRGHGRRGCRRAGSGKVRNGRLRQRTASPGLGACACVRGGDEGRGSLAGRGTGGEQGCLQTWVG